MSNTPKPCISLPYQRGRAGSRGAASTFCGREDARAPAPRLANLSNKEHGGHFPPPRCLSPPPRLLQAWPGCSARSAVRPSVSRIDCTNILVGCLRLARPSDLGSRSSMHLRYGVKAPLWHPRSSPLGDTSGRLGEDGSNNLNFYKRFTAPAG